MKKVCLLCCMLIVARVCIHGQLLIEKLRVAVDVLEKDSQLRHGILSFYVADGKTGKLIFQKNPQTGMAPASTQKIITSATVFELLGKDFRYKTMLGYKGNIENGILKGDLFITGSADPTLGSWRFTETKDEKILLQIVNTMKQHKITHIEGSIYIDESGYSIQSVPDGWIWQDIGNYYGAGSWGLNWKENQYDLILRPGKKIGDTTKIISQTGDSNFFSLTNTITTGQKGSGDNGYIYLPPYAVSGFTTGTIPPGGDFTISGSMSNPPLQFSNQLNNLLVSNNIILGKGFRFYLNSLSNQIVWPRPEATFDSILSPVFDSINYWFLKKSINLYGEALIKALAKERNGFGSTEKGIEIIRDFWKQHGIEPASLNIIDGSGLSPQNRVTTHALVQILQYAKTRTWFPSFYEALPVYNGMKIKSGSIGGARSFAGYHTSAGGKLFVFAIIVNNYDGSSGNIVKKMYRVLDLLK